MEGLRTELRGYTDNEVADLKRALTKKITEQCDLVKFECDRLRAEFEQFKNKDFAALEARVTALERKFLKL